MDRWICDGIPKNGQSYPTAREGGHEPYENIAPECLICGLPREAMGGETTTERTANVTPSQTVMTGSGKNNNWLIPMVIAVIVVGFAGGAAGWLLFRPKTSPPPVFNDDPDQKSQNSLVSENAANSHLLSQGEKILLDKTADKEAGSAAFAQKDWDGAIAAYQQAAQNNPNDPEGKIYLNNAKAHQKGSPLTIA